MTATAPRFLLFSQTNCHGTVGQWRILLTSADGEKRLIAGDHEPEDRGERLELLAVVRGLEALEQPSQVTLMSGSRYVSNGLTYGLADWRENGWRWERDGRLVPVKNRDLWQRIDRALEFHEVECRTWWLDSPHVPPPSAVERAADIVEEDVSQPPTVQEPHFKKRARKPRQSNARTTQGNRAHSGVRRQSPPTWLGERLQNAFWKSYESVLPKLGLGS